MNETSKNYAKIASLLTNCLNLSQSPVAISFTDAIPNGVGRHVGDVSAGCRFWQDGAMTVFATSSSDHQRCAIGVYTHHLQPTPAQQTDLMGALKIFGELSYVREEDLPLIPVLQQQSAHVIYAPLAETPLPPQIVLLFVNASQMLILSEAAQQVEHGNTAAMGRPACAVVPQVINTGRAALSLGCCGARAYLDTLTDDTAIFAIPGAKLDFYAERIEALAQANSILTRFHHIRREEIAAGKSPSIQDSLKAMGA
ncbi:DUF169 domain-containing protein [Acidobacterium sp. S8]|uniref:DUF169 domain-containing protein n=1 Tax=Acidobacterium sp. S8 TaxID=1641854 RepID=UPI00131DFA3D|nr:DUF169 domain-containing protein [Acidobacterium sp. S8]